MKSLTHRGTNAAVEPEEKRSHCVSVRLNKSEIAWLDQSRGKLQRGEFLRAASMGKLPKTIPTINREHWQELARIGSNINQIAARLNMGHTLPLDEVREEIMALRMALVGVEL